MAGPVIVQVWFVPQEERFLDSLPPAERAEADRYRSPAARRAFATGRAALRSILRAETGREPELSLRPDGKPEWRGGPRFNLSHSGDFVAIALCDGAEVGIDLERVVERRDLHGLARRFFAPEEAADVEKLGLRAFYEIWTRKEAYAKALGAGVRLGFSTFAAPASGWTLLPLPAPRGYVAALAVHSGTPQVVHRDFPPPPR
jgi:4'-phosphopantetheinyl transferase